MSAARRLVSAAFLAVLVLTITQRAHASILGVTPTAYNAASMLKASGVAHDANESILGFVTIKEPRSFFKPDAPQFTWWGEFKPFKFWASNPEFKARWYSPASDTEPVAEQNFNGMQCVLAKTTLKTDSLQKPLAEGKWRVDVYHKGQKIDSKNFIVYGGKKPSLSLQTTLPG